MRIPRRWSSVRRLPLLLAAVLLLSWLSGFFDAPMTHAVATTTSTNAPTTCTSTSTAVWATPANAMVNDTSFSTISVRNTTKLNYLTCKGFGFSIPTGATITGITVSIGRKSSRASTVQDNYVTLIKAGTRLGSTTPTLSVKPDSLYWPTTQAAGVYGATASDLWGSAWTAADINSANFGVEVSAKNTTTTNRTASVNYFTMTVGYSYNPTFAQSAYQWYTNADNLTLTAPLNGVAQNTSAPSLYNQGLFRLRMLLHIGGDVAPAAANYAFKLQLATKGAGACSGSEPYSDVTTSTAIAYGDNPSLTDGQSPVVSSYPTHGSDTIVAGQYNELNNTSITADVVGGRDIMFDFALKDIAAQYNASYCFRMVNSDGSLLSAGYSVFPTLTTPIGLTNIDFVDSSGVSVLPQFPMSTITANYTCQSSTGTIGSLSGNRLRITQNGNAGASGWHVDIAANFSTSTWSDGAGHSYDFNDPAGIGCTAGADGDAVAGQISFSPSVGAVTGLNGCVTTGISLPAGTLSFASGTNTPITLINSTNASSANCQWDISGIAVSQTIPANQNPGLYTIDLIVSVITS